VVSTTLFGVTMRARLLAERDNEARQVLAELGADQ
jgi:hypothetical protein